MTTTHTLGRVATSIRPLPDKSGFQVWYHKTPVVTVTDKTIVLNTGGWRTVTTKRRMNQAANQFGLGFSVHQADFAWTISTDDGRTIPFDKDIVSFNR